MYEGLFGPDGVVSEAARLVHTIEGFPPSWLLLTSLQSCLTSLISWPTMDTGRHRGHATLHADNYSTEDPRKCNARSGRGGLHVGYWTGGQGKVSVSP